MQLRQVGRSGLFVSSLGLGGMTIGRETDEGTADRMVGAFIDAGGTFVDTADVYAGGGSEEILGRVLAGRRATVVLATKVGLQVGDGRTAVGCGRSHVMASLERSLRRLDTDHVDLLQIHAWDRHTPIEETIRALDDAVRSGKARYIGISNSAAWMIAKSLGASALLGAERFACVQLEYSLACRDAERELLPLCRSEGLGAMAWSPLAGGLLSGKYTRTDTPDGARCTLDNPAARMARERRTEATFQIVDVLREQGCRLGATPAAVALRWVHDQADMTSVVLGARDERQLTANLAALDVALDDEARAALEGASAIALGYPHEYLATKPDLRNG